MKDLLSSKKFIATIVGLVAVMITGFLKAVKVDIPEAQVTELVGLVAAYIVAQGIADSGKEKAKVEAETALAVAAIAAKADEKKGTIIKPDIGGAS